MIDGRCLLEKGYFPLPVPKGKKGCFLPNWPRLQWVNETYGGVALPYFSRGLERQWTGKAPGIALRLDGLLMFDFDIDVYDKKPEESAIWDLVDQHFGSKRAIVPVRYRANSSRIALIVRCPEVNEKNFRKTTPVWEEGKVELQGGPGRIIFAWGPHPSGVNLRWQLPYSQLDPHLPDDFPSKDALDGISLARAQEILQSLARELVAEYGPALKLSTGLGLTSNEAKRVYDLEPSMVFTTNRDSSYTAAELRELARPGGTGAGQIFVNLTPFRPDSDSMAGLVGWSQEDSCLIITDFVDGIVHAEIAADAGAEPIDVGGLGLESFFESDDSKRATKAREDANPWLFVQELNGYLRKNNPSARPIVAAAMFHGLPAEGRRELLKAVPAVERTIWDPKLPALSVLEQDGVRKFNTFRYPNWQGEGEIETFRSALTRILPVAEQREAYEHWLAAKVQHPERRLFPVALVGAKGVGKTSLSVIVQRLWGPDVVQMVGTMERAFTRPYQDYLYRTLYVFFDEVTNTDAGHDARSRMKAANMLKVLGDTTVGSQQLELKYGAYVTVDVVATVGVTTNDPGALPLEDDDRRWAVFEAGPPMEANPLFDWVDVEANRAAFFRFYGEMDIGGFNTWKPPRTAAKARMAELSKSELDESIYDFVVMVRACGGMTTQAIFADFCEMRGIVGPRKHASHPMFQRAFPYAARLRIEGKIQRVRMLSEKTALCTPPEERPGKLAELKRMVLEDDVPE